MAPCVAGRKAHQPHGRVVGGRQRLLVHVLRPAAALLLHRAEQELVRVGVDAAFLLATLLLLLRRRVGLSSRQLELKGALHVVHLRAAAPGEVLAARDDGSLRGEGGASRKGVGVRR